MRKAKGKRNLIGIIVSFLIVIATGYGLYTAGYLENPFRVFTSLSSGGEGERGERPAMGERPAGADFGERAEGGEAASGLSLSSLQWSRFGEVLFDLWFFFACSVAMVLLGAPIGKLIKRAKNFRLQSPEAKLAAS